MSKQDKRLQKIKERQEGSACGCIWCADIRYMMEQLETVTAERDRLREALEAKYEEDAGAAI